MKVPIYVSAVLLMGFLVMLRGAPSTESTRVDTSSGSRRPELEYLKAVNTVAPPQDPQLLFLLMAEYSNANLQGQGAEFFSTRLKEFGPRLTDAQKSLYLSTIGLLRAQHASSVSLLHRIGYVKETIAMLDQAKRLSGVVRSQIPSFFHQRQAAQDDLTWCAANIAKAPNIGWLREVDFRLGSLALADGDQVKAQDYLRQSGYKSFDEPVVLTTPFSE